MASKEDKEAALNAKIAAIRAANEATERRHREVQADRLKAEKTKSSITVKDGTEEDGGAQGPTVDRFKNPFESSGKASKKPIHERITPNKASPREDQPQRRRAGRLADDDGPPPDPGYSFLADRMRDGSPEAGDDDDNRTGPKAATPANKFPSRDRSKKEPLVNRRSAGPGGRDRPIHQDENVSPKHRMNRNSMENRVAQNIRDIREETSRGSNHIRPLMPEQQIRNHNSPSSALSRTAADFKTSGAQARLDRSRSHTVGPLNPPLNENGNDNNHRKVTEIGRKNISVKVDFDQLPTDQKHAAIADNNEHVVGHLKTDQPPPPVAQVQLLHEVPVAPPPELRQPLQNTPLVVSAPSFVPSQDHSSQWQPMPINQWDPQSQAAQPQSQQMVIGHWDPGNQGMVQPQWTQPVQGMADWSGAAVAAPEVYHQMHNQAAAQQSAAMYDQQQYMHIPFQDTANPMMIPIGSHPDYMTHPPMVHHHGHQAMTQITHATMPIMASQQYIPPATHKPDYYGRGFSRPAPNGSSRSSYSWRNPDKEVTRIPPRFQKQRPSANNHQSSEKALDTLPRATSRTAPSTAKRLTIFGTSNVVNSLNESELGEDLGVPVRIIAAMKLNDFKEKIGMVDPEKDRLVLIHGLGNDARNIALKNHKNDVDKGAESDGLANEFADVVLDLIERIPFIKVLISTLLPRFDNEDQVNMSNPNNVRKVMNVEISMRLQDKPNIEFINNDTVLEWWKDDVKKMRLFAKDGYHLSAYGFSMMLEQWMKTLKSSAAQLGLLSDNDDSASPDADENDTPVIPRVQSPVKDTSTSSEKEVPNTTNELPVSDNELPNLEEVTPKMASVSLIEEAAKDIPLPAVTSDDDEFHEASESHELDSPTEGVPVVIQPTEEKSIKPSEEEEFKEKSNEEKMEKEMTNTDDE